MKLYFQVYDLEVLAIFCNLSFARDYAHFGKNKILQKIV